MSDDDEIYGVNTIINFFCILSHHVYRFNGPNFLLGRRPSRSDNYIYGGQNKTICKNVRHISL
jgi:hypothetical protein